LLPTTIRVYSNCLFLILQSSAYRRHAEARNCAPQVAAYQSQRKARRNALRKREISGSHAGLFSAVTSMISDAVSRLPSKTGSASPPHITNIQNVRASLLLLPCSKLSSDIRHTVHMCNCSRGDRRPVLHQQRVRPARSDRGTEVGDPSASNFTICSNMHNQIEVVSNSS
jgi:hypothetical protein